MALAYQPPGVYVEEISSITVNPLLAEPALVCLVGQAQGYVQRTDQIALTNTDDIPLPNFPRETASLVDPVISVRNINEASPYVESADYTVNYDSDVDEVQLLDILGSTDGTFKIKFYDEWTADITYPASAATVQTDLEALSNIDPGDVTVTGNSGGPYTLTFGGQYANQNLPNVEADTTALNGTSPSYTIHTITQGGVLGTVKREGAGSIPEGATVTVVYKYLPENYFQATRVDSQGLLEELYGPALNADGSINSPVSFAGQAVLENGARTVVVQPLFRLQDDQDENSLRVTPTGSELEDAITWEQSFRSLRIYEDINVVIPVVGQTGTLSDAEFLSIAQKLQAHIDFMHTEQQYMIGILGEDSSVDSARASAETLRSHAEALRSAYNGRLAENIVWVSPAHFTRINPSSNVEIHVGGQYVAAAIGGMLAARRVSDSLTRDRVIGFERVVDTRTKTDRNADAASGLTVIEQIGRAIQVRHGITLSNEGVHKREINVVRGKHLMIESIRTTLEEQIIGKIIADEDAPIIVASTVDAVLERLQRGGDIVGYTSSQARTLVTEPTTVEVRFSYRPAFPLNYINVIFSLDVTTGTVEVI
jgi:hypothetical protein